MIKLCSRCGYEFEPKTEIIEEERFGKPKREIEVEEDICPNCQEDSEF